MSHINANHHFFLDKSVPTDKTLDTGVIIIIGLVPAISLISIVAIITIVLCVVQKKCLLDYKLKKLVIDNTSEYIRHLQQQIENETRPEILKELIQLMSTASDRLLNPSSVPMVPLVSAMPVKTQTSTEHVETTIESDSSLRPPGLPIIVKTVPENSDVESGLDLKEEEEGGEEERVVERRTKVSFRRRVSMEESPIDQSQVTAFEQLTHLFATFLSKAVHDSLLNASQHNPLLADRVEREVKCAMFQRQQSIASSGGGSYTECSVSCDCYSRSVSLDTDKTCSVNVEENCSLERRNTMA